MQVRFWAASCGSFLLVACAPKSSVPDGTAVVDEEVRLERQQQTDVASREVTVDARVILVAIVDENLTDVRVKLSSADRNVAPVEVENNFEGAGLEIAALEVPRGAKVAVTLTGAQHAQDPGAVRLRVLQFNADADDDPRFAALLQGYRAWSDATAANYRAADIVGKALPAIDRAVAGFSGTSGDLLLAAEALRVKANMSHYFMIDVRQAYEAASRSIELLEVARADSAVPLARARFMQALALADLATNPGSQSPSAQEANAMARELLADLFADGASPNPIERARAVSTLAMMDRNESKADDAAARFAEAMAMYKGAGYVAGEITTLAQQAQLFVDRGAFPQAAMAYRQLIPEIQKIPDPKLRVSAMLGAGRALGFLGRTDQGMDMNMQALAIAREYGMKPQQGEAAYELAWMYWFRGDLLQAKALFGEALKTARGLDNNVGLPYALNAYGLVARADGDFETAMRMHEEAVELASVPTQRIRAMRGLAQDHEAVGRHDDAMAGLRAALGVDVQDPNHNIFTDIRRDLAELLARYGGGESAALAEAERLIDASLRMAVKMEDPLNQIGAYRVRALLHTKQGRHAAARADFDRAFDLVFRYRESGANAQLRVQSLEQEQLAFRDYFDLMMRSVATDGAGAPREARADEQDALRTLERARQSHLGFARNVKLDAETAARVDALLVQMAEKSLQISRSQDTPGLDALQAEMTRLRLEMDGLRLAAARQHAAKESPAVAKARAWRSVAPGAVQVSYALGNEHAYVWVRDASGLRVAMLSATPEALEREVATLASFDAQGSPEKIEESLARLSPVLMPESLVPPDSNALEIIAEGRIANVAFAGLWSPTDASRRLVETHAVTLISSMHAEQQAPIAMQPRPFRFVALASGTGQLRSARAVHSLPMLQAATSEIQGIAELFTARDKSARVKLFAGRGGSAEVLRGIWSSGADVVHFATHALADLRQPLASLLVLPAQDAAGTPAYLTAGQVQEWRGDADLVFLSACESAIGPPRFAGGMPGLQSAFLRAGARGVVATMWPIEDVLAREFTADFYRRYTAGMSAAQALSETQRAWLQASPGMSDAEQRRRRVNAIAHAYFTP